MCKGVKNLIANELILPNGGFPITNMLFLFFSGEKSKKSSTAYNYVQFVINIFLPFHFEV